VPAIDIAFIHAGLGNKTEAIEWLEKACEQRAAFITGINVWPNLDSLRDIPGFADVVRRMGLEPIRSAPRQNRKVS